MRNRTVLLVATRGVPFLGSAGGTHIGFVSSGIQLAASDLAHEPGGPPLGGPGR